MIESFKLPNITPETVSGSICSFSDEYGGLPLKSCTSLISGYQEGSGTPSPSNVRPLHAFSSASLGKTGKNLFDKNNSNQILNAYFSGGSSSIIVESSITKIIYIKCKPNTTYTLSRLAGKRFELGYTKVLPSLNVRVYDKISRNTASSITITTGADAQYLVSYIFNSTVDTATLSDLLDSIQIEENDEATAYESFGNSYTFTFGQDIYQGYIDWKRGVVTAIWAKANTSIMIWGKSQSGLFVSSSLVGIIKNNTSPYTPSPYIKCSVFECVDSSSITGPQGGTPSPNGVFAENTEGVVYFNLISETTIEGFVDYMSDKQFIYELATPIEIPLGGINLLTQEGTNNIFCDTGNTTLEWLKVN